MMRRLRRLSLAGLLMGLAACWGSSFSDVDIRSPPPARAYWSDIERFLKDNGVLE